MLSYQQLKYHPRALRAFTGLDQAEFEKLHVILEENVNPLDIIRNKRIIQFALRLRIATWL
jgi:hypothetical protein